MHPAAAYTMYARIFDHQVSFILAKDFSKSFENAIPTLAPEQADVSKYRKPRSFAHRWPSSSLTTRLLSIFWHEKQEDKSVGRNDEVHEAV